MVISLSSFYFFQNKEIGLKVNFGVPQEIWNLVQSNMVSFSRTTLRDEVSSLSFEAMAAQYSGVGAELWVYTFSLVRWDFSSQRYFFKTAVGPRCRLSVQGVSTFFGSNVSEA
jgi:hypothetical protein